MNELGTGYIIFATIVLALMGALLLVHFIKSPKNRLNFILEAQKAGSVVLGKLTCLTMEGTYDFPYYKSEYMYVINDKIYYVTYQTDIKNLQLTQSDSFKTPKDMVDANILVNPFQDSLKLYYNARNPEKVMCKAEVFVSPQTMHKVRTDYKNNEYRSINKTWNKAIDLRVRV